MKTRIKKTTDLTIPFHFRVLFLTTFFLLTFLFQSCGPKWTVETREDFTIVFNKGGKTLGYSTKSGVEILTDKRFAFKD